MWTSVAHSLDLVGLLWYAGTTGNRGKLLLNAATSSIIVGCKKIICFHDLPSFAYDRSTFFTPMTKYPSVK